MFRVRLGIDLGERDRSRELAAYFDKRRLYLGLFFHVLRSSLAARPVSALRISAFIMALDLLTHSPTYLGLDLSCRTILHHTNKPRNEMLLFRFSIRYRLLRSLGWMLGAGDREKEYEDQSKELHTDPTQSPDCS